MPLTRIATILLIVAPFAGAWIEIVEDVKLDAIQLRRTLRGCVD